MKRLLCFVVILLSVTLVACKKEVLINYDNEYHFETDCQYYNCFGGGLYSLAESEDGYYYIRNGYVHFIDKKTMADTPLCGKPNCLHDSVKLETQEEQEQCNAFVGISVLQTIRYYEGKLYTISRGLNSNSEFYSGLIEISLDGTSRKEIWDFSREDGHRGDDTPMYYTIHRGVFYYIADGLSEKKDTLFAYDLTKKKAKVIYEGDVDVLRAIGKYLYFREVDDGREHTIRYDLSTGETLCMEDCGEVIPVQDELLVYTFLAKDDEYQHIFEVQTKDGEPIRAYDLSVEGKYKVLQTDGTYLFVTENIGFGDNTIRVYDYKTTEKIATLEIPEVQDMFLSCTLDGKLILFDMRVTDFYYCNISDIGTPDFQWYEVEKIN